MNFIKCFFVYLVFMIAVLYGDLNDITIPNTFSANTPARASEVNENFDSVRIAYNRTVDSLNNDFARYTDFDSTDTNFNEIFMDTVKSLKGRFAVCTTGIANIDTAIITDITGTTVDLNGGTIDGITIGGSTEAAGYFDTLHSVKGITCTSINTGNGNFEIGQDLLTTSDVTFDSITATKIVADTITASSILNAPTTAATFATVNTGQGDNELYDMDQNVLTTSNVNFNRVEVGTAPLTSTANFNIKEVGASALVEMYLQNFSSNAALMPLFRLMKSHSATDALVSTIDTEILGQIQFEGVNSSNVFQRGSTISCVQNGSASTFTPSNLLFATSDGATAPTEKLRITKDGDIITKEISSSITPAPGFGNWYWKTDGLPYGKNDAGTEITLGTQTGTFQGRTVGLATEDTSTVYYTICDSVVTLSIPLMTGTSNAVFFELEDLPAALTVTSNVYSTFILVDNGATMVCTGEINTGGLIKFTASNDVLVFNNWTATGTKSINAQTIQYRLN